MRSTLIILAATIAGIGLAWVLFAPAPTLPPSPSVVAAKPAVITPVGEPAPAGDAASKPEPPTAANQAFQTRINQPDAALSGQQASVWTIIRRELTFNTDPAAQALMQEASDLVRDLREARLRPDSADTKALADRAGDLRKRIEASPFNTPQITEQFQRLTDLKSSFDAQAAMPGGFPPTEPPAMPPTAPPAGGAAPRVVPTSAAGTAQGVAPPGSAPE
jgi:hypothetical protein